VLGADRGNIRRVSDLPLFLLIKDSSDRVLAGRRIELSPSNSPITVGRDPECTVEVRSASVSRRHARFELRSDGWYVVDEASTFGTYVDDVMVEDRLLREGETVRIGDTLLGLAHYIVESHFQPNATDGLTGLTTRRHLLERLEAAMRSAERPLALIRIDVDKLKVINHDRGHEAGDRILAELGAQLLASLRPSEYAGRLGADDFVVVLAGTDLRAASARAAELQAQLAAIAPVSVGTAELMPTHRDADELIYTAEKDLFARYRTPPRLVTSLRTSR
jgi:diguanylate cyclase (GGDEF)-like protein